MNPSKVSYLMEHINQKLADRFWSKVDTSGDCWLWTASKAVNGYGTFSVGPAGTRQLFMAHRVALAFSGTLDIAGMEVCHHCDTPACVRPEHLFIGTKSDSMQDMRSKGRGKGLQSTCKRGHSLSDQANTYVYGSQRVCIACQRYRYRASRGEGGDAS